MKSKLILMGAMVAISLSLFACSPASKEVSVNVSWDDFKKEQHISQEVEVAVDGSLTITLYSCPGEGRQWSESAQISDQTVLREVDHKYEPPPKPIGCMLPVPGAPGQEVWTFEALEKGMSTISMDYTHPWDGEEEPMLTFALTVVVK